MFILACLEDKIRVVPSDLDSKSITAVTSVIEQTYIDKVVADLGLVMSLYDVQQIEGGFIYPSEGSAHFQTKFRLVVFRPFVGEVIVGKLTKSSKEGLHVSVGFFDDIFIPEYSLQEPSFFNEAEQLWFWKFDGNEMYMDLDEPIRFRVKDLKFKPTPLPAALKDAAAEDSLPGTAANPFAPMEVIGEINEDGLGLLNWWQEGGDAMED
ncbi:hypothetical protein WJX72_010172 [[Myrmecia] bisecta]|uniref:RNA polymerase III subunit C25 n=1 Tax=[Myrmecia] bisecta TaxID=41462 RepID=A0AAW1Q6D9_9CHLO